VHRYYTCLLTFILRNIGDRARVENLVEVLIRVFGHRRRFARAKWVSTWTYTIALNVAKNELRAGRLSRGRTRLANSSNRCCTRPHPKS
jgi:DNA-directed RNA polymerase specialized sigma24 family protein